MKKATVCACCGDPAYGRRSNMGCCRSCLTLSDLKWEAGLDEMRRIREYSHGESLLEKAVLRQSFTDADTANVNLRWAALRSKSLPAWMIPIVATFTDPQFHLEYHLFKLKYLT